MLIFYSNRLTTVPPSSRFEEETEALLQRCTNPRRLSGCISEETEKEKTLCKNDRMIHDSPPPVVVTRRNLPNVCAKNFGPGAADDGCKKSPRTGLFVRVSSSFECLASTWIRTYTLVGLFSLF